MWAAVIPFQRQVMTRFTYIIPSSNARDLDNKLFDLRYKFLRLTANYRGSIAGSDASFHAINSQKDRKS